MKPLALTYAANIAARMTLLLALWSLALGFLAFGVFADEKGLISPVHADSVQVANGLAAKDSLSDSALAHLELQRAARRDSLLRGELKQTETDEDAVAEARTTNYALSFAADVHRTGIGGDDFAKAFYVVAAIVVVGGTLIYLPVVVYKLIRNEEKFPLRHEVGLTYLYSSSYWQSTEGGPKLYRDTHMPGMRYTALIARPVIGLGLTLEGGYLAPDFGSSLQVTEQIDVHGAYGLIGPMLRFWPESPASLSLEFLNGTSTSTAVGWVTKARASAQMKLGRHAFFSLQLGSLFYDLHFFDGTVWHEGAFNRDLALTLGVEAGYAF